jgi:hypothetical protein
MTDWSQVERFVEAFAKTVPMPAETPALVST